jgi:hypothetical protein
MRDALLELLNNRLDLLPYGSVRTLINVEKFLGRDFLGSLGASDRRQEASQQEYFEDCSPQDVPHLNDLRG